MIFDKENKYRIYLDVKDSRSGSKILKLHKILANANCDFDRTMVERVQAVKSDDVALLQIVDILIGALQYSKHYSLGDNAKSRLARHIQEKSGLDFTRNTLPREIKFNLFHWRGVAL